MRGLQLLHARERDGVVLLAEMELHRAVRLLVREVRHAAAVVADRGGEGARARGGDPRDRAAPAVADAAADARDLLGRRLDVGERIRARPLADGAAAGDVVGAVAELDAALDPVEQRRRDRDVALCRIVVAHRADVAVDPKISCATTSAARPAGSARYMLKRWPSAAVPSTVLLNAPPCSAAPGAAVDAGLGGDRFSPADPPQPLVFGQGVDRRCR